MGRHEQPRTKGRLATPVVIAIPLAVVLLVAGGLVLWVTSSDGGCEQRRQVAVTVAPEMAAVAEEVLADPVDLGEGACAVADVTAQAPLQTVADLGALEADALPQVWVPDSSLWTARAAEVPLESAGSVGSSPVVVATSRAVADELGWTDRPPTWGEALTTDRPVAMPDIAGRAPALLALAAVHGSQGDAEEADDAVVQAILTAQRRAAPDPAEALDAGGENAADAPLVPVPEQEVLARNAGDAGSLVAVYPADGSPALDYPVLRVGAPSGAERAAVDAVVEALTSDSARAAAHHAGFRGEDGAAPADAGPDTGTQEAAPETLEPAPDQLEALLETLASLAVPPRMLAVFDVSTSMDEPVGTGTRATLARDAAKSALTLFPDSAAIGLWVFAVGLDGAQDYDELAPIRRLDGDAGGRPQREVLIEAIDSIPSRLTPGGTGLYDTTLAAVRTVRHNYDSRALNSVVLVTDGRDDDDSTIGRDALLQALRDEVDPDRPVRVIGIALGPDADLAALQQIAEAAGGAAYPAVDPEDLQTVLFDALRQQG